MWSCTRSLRRPSIRQRFQTSRALSRSNKALHLHLYSLLAVITGADPEGTVIDPTVPSSFTSIKTFESLSLTVIFWANPAPARSRKSMKKKDPDLRSRREILQVFRIISIVHGMDSDG
jgi:hypothetical protein